MLLGANAIIKWSLKPTKSAVPVRLRTWQLDSASNEGSVVCRLDWPLTSQMELAPQLFARLANGELQAIDDQWRSLRPEDVVPARANGAALLWLATVPPLKSEFGQGSIVYQVPSSSFGGNWEMSLGEGSPRQASRTIGNHHSIERGAASVFVGGFQKSGTTWLQTLINAHPDVLVLNESDINPLNWLALHRDLAPRYVRMDLLGWRGRERLLAMDFLELSRNLASSLGFKAVGDKTPSELRWAQRLSEVDSMVAFCVRDPADVLVSMAAHTLNVASNGGPTTPLVGKVMNEHESRERQIRALANEESFALAVLRNWISYNWSIGDEVKSPRDNLLPVFYEVMTESPTRTLKTIYKRCGVSSAAHLVSDATSGASFSEMSGGRLPGQSAQTAFVRDGRVGQGRSTISKRILKLLQQVTSNEAPQSLSKLVRDRNYLGF